MVSHDADFLDSVCTDVVHLEESQKNLPETNSRFAPENGVPLEVWRFLLETSIYDGELLVLGSHLGMGGWNFLG